MRRSISKKRQNRAGTTALDTSLNTEGLYWSGANPVPVFYFHIDSDQQDLDDEGVELSTIADARDQALYLLSGVLQNGAGRTIWNGNPLKLWVTDGPSGAGETLIKIEVNATRPLPTHRQR
jgi:hypothetical protein